MMAIPEGHKANFHTMQQAAEHEQLALMECTRKADGEKIYVICAVNWYPGAKEEYEFIPLAKLFDGNPYDEVLPPGMEDAVEIEKDSLVELTPGVEYKRSPIDGGNGSGRSGPSDEVREEGESLQPTDDPAS